MAISVPERRVTCFPAIEGVRPVPTFRYREPFTGGGSRGALGLRAGRIDECSAIPMFLHRHTGPRTGFFGPDPSDVMQGRACLGERELDGTAEGDGRCD